LLLRSDAQSLEFGFMFFPSMSVGDLLSHR
jgi:hypothetical protein